LLFFKFDGLIPYLPSSDIYQPLTSFVLSSGSEEDSEDESEEDSEVLVSPPVFEA